MSFEIKYKDKWIAERYVEADSRGSRTAMACILLPFFTGRQADCWVHICLVIHRKAEESGRGKEGLL